MSLLQKMLRWVLFPLLLFWVLLVALVVQAPVDWLLGQARQQGWLPAAIQWQQVDGDLGQGQLSGLKLPGLELEQLQWSLSTSRLLFGWPHLTLKLGADEQEAWQLTLSLAPWGQVRGLLQPGDLDLLRTQPMRVDLQGQLDGSLDFAAQRQAGRWVCSGIEGEISGAVQVIQPLPVNLGQIQLSPACDASGLFSGLLTSDREQQHQLKIEGRASSSNWSFTGTAEVAADAELIPVLQLLQWRRQPNGHYQAQGSGRFQ